jgi:hypothetical protein
MPNNDEEQNEEGLTDRASFSQAARSTLEYCSLTEPAVNKRAPHLETDVVGNGRYAYVSKPRKFDQPNCLEVAIIGAKIKPRVITAGSSTGLQNLRMTDLFVVAKKDLLKRRMLAFLKGHL